MNHLSDKQLVSALDKLVRTESELTVTIVAHIAQVEERKLYLAEGYSSMFQFLQEKYHYSESSAWRRLSAARALRQFPQVRVSLESQAINLSTLGLIAKVLTSDNCNEILQAASGKSQREVEKMLIQRGENVPGVETIHKGKLCKDKVKVVAVKAHQTGIRARDIEAEAPMIALFSAGSASPATSAQELSEQEPEAQIAYRIEFYADAELQGKMQMVRNRLSSTYPTGATIAQMLNVLADNYLNGGKRSFVDTPGVDISSADTAAERSVEPRGEMALGSSVQCIADPDSQAPRTSAVSFNTGLHTATVKPSRYLSKTVRDLVRIRDGGRCTFVGTNGKRCGSTWDLEYEHVVAFAKGGSNDASNLTLLCRAHNHYRAEQTFGKEFMRKKKNEPRTSAAKVDNSLDNFNGTESALNGTEDYLKSTRKTQRVRLRTS